MASYGIVYPMVVNMRDHPEFALEIGRDNCVWKKGKMANYM
jgi:hypothetical protein